MFIFKDSFGAMLDFPFPSLPKQLWTQQMMILILFGNLTLKEVLVFMSVSDVSTDTDQGKMLDIIIRNIW